LITLSTRSRDVIGISYLLATITFGGNIRLSPQSTLSIGVSEDVKVRSAPDVAFQLALHYQPD
jgi:hypothetical protein